MFDKDSYETIRVFTPTSPARLTFVERESINDRLVNALRVPGLQLVVYGHTGSGKTTLLTNKLHQLYESHITTRCTGMMSFEDILLDAFDQLAPFVNQEAQNRTVAGAGAELSAQYILIRGQISTHRAIENETTARRILPPQLTAQALARFLGTAHCCWVLEDFHKVPSEEKSKVAQVMKLFMDLADSYPFLKIVAVGAVDTARQVIEYDNEMRNRVAEVHVPLMEEDEIRSIVNKGEELLNFVLSPEVKQEIVRYSNGVAGACHQIALNMCLVSGIERTLESSAELGGEQLSSALEMYVEAASDTLKAAFDSGLRPKRKRKYDNGYIILRSLCSFDQNGATHAELLSEIRKDYIKYPASNLTFYVGELQTSERGGLLRKDGASGRISFADPIYRVHAQAVFRPKEGSNRDAVGMEEMRKLVLEEIFKEFRLGFDVTLRRGSVDRRQRSLRFNFDEAPDS